MTMDCSCASFRGRSMAGREPLELFIGVRIPAPEPLLPCITFQTIVIRNVPAQPVPRASHRHNGRVAVVELEYGVPFGA